jgi:heat shock protein HslJ
MRRPPRSTLLLLVLLALAVGATACGDDDGDEGDDGAASEAPGPATPLGSWRLLSFTDEGVAVPSTSITSAVATMDLSEDGAAGSTGCNRYRAEVELDGDLLRILPGPTTMAACTQDGANRQERALLDTLPRVVTWRTAQDRLLLYGEGGDQLLAFVGQTGGVEGEWQVTGVNTGDAVESSALTEALSLQFSAGAITGHGGCNGFSGQYRVDGSSLEVGDDLMRTLIGCDPDVAALEEAFLAALVRVASFEADGDTLTLRSDDGAMQVVLDRAG